MKYNVTKDGMIVVREEDADNVVMEIPVSEIDVTPNSELRELVGDLKWNASQTDAFREEYAEGLEFATDYAIGELNGILEQGEVSQYQVWLGPNDFLVKATGEDEAIERAKEKQSEDETVPNFTDRASVTEL